MNQENKYYRWNDGFFTYYINVETGEKKWKLEKDDIEVPAELDDFQEKQRINKQITEIGKLLR